MKPILVIFLLLFLVSPVFAQGLTLAPKCDPTLPPNAKPGPNGPPCNITAFISWIRQIIQFLTIIAVPIGIGFIVYGGFVIMTAGGSGDRVSKGKGIITASVIGLAIVFGAWLIITTVRQILGAI